eukprot:6201872-Pleurochrysis_carterae.AAC.2
MSAEGEGAEQARLMTQRLLVHNALDDVGVRGEIGLKDAKMVRVDFGMQLQGRRPQGTGDVTR